MPDTDLRLAEIVAALSLATDLGTGNTAMRPLGRKPMTLQRFGAYARPVRNLLDGKDAQYEHNGETQTIRFMLTEKGYRNLRDPIPMYLAG